MGLVEKVETDELFDDIILLCYLTETFLVNNKYARRDLRVWSKPVPTIVLKAELDKIR